VLCSFGNPLTRMSPVISPDVLLQTGTAVQEGQRDGTGAALRTREVTGGKGEIITAGCAAQLSHRPHRQSMRVVFPAGQSREGGGEARAGRISLIKRWPAGAADLPGPRLAPHASLQVLTPTMPTSAELACPRSAHQGGQHVGPEDAADAAQQAERARMGALSWDVGSSSVSILPSPHRQAGSTGERQWRVIVRPAGTRHATRSSKAPASQGTCLPACTAPPAAAVSSVSLTHSPEAVAPNTPRP
jgi:hypothetical protein